MPTFYGPADEQVFNKFISALEVIQNVWQKIGAPSFLGDNMVALSRNMDFSSDPGFMDAVRQYTEDDADFSKVWRMHTYCWACRSALSLPGDLVECGVYRGLYSAVMAATLNFATHDRTLYLYDTFEGLPEAYSTEHERRNTNPHYNFADAFELVTTRFAAYANVRIVRGAVPESFNTAVPDKVAFLHLDMNAAIAETAALDFLFERIVPGGIILLDDYGRFENRNLHDAHQTWFESRGYAILELPTGQGMVIRR